MKGEMNRTIIICVDSYDNGVPSGRFHFASNQDVKTFQSLTQLLVKINGILEEEKFPQSFAELRKFHAPQKQLGAPDKVSTLKNGALATFSVRILFRQNASWQGSLSWVDGNQEQYFRSVLEMILLMDNALGYSIEA